MLLRQAYPHLVKTEGVGIFSRYLQSICLLTKQDDEVGCCCDSISPFCIFREAHGQGNNPAFGSGKPLSSRYQFFLRDARDPVEAAQAYCNDGADELVFLDITATIEKRNTAKIELADNLIWLLSELFAMSFR
jgi:hypothetical protein